MCLCVMNYLHLLYIIYHSFDVTIASTISCDVLSGSGVSTLADQYYCTCTAIYKAGSDPCWGRV